MKDLLAIIHNQMVIDCQRLYSIRILPSGRVIVLFLRVFRLRRIRLSLQFRGLFIRCCGYGGGDGWFGAFHDAAEIFAAGDGGLADWDWVGGAALRAGWKAETAAETSSMFEDRFQFCGGADFRGIVLYGIVQHCPSDFGGDCAVAHGGEAEVFSGLDGAGEDVAHDIQFFVVERQRFVQC